MERRRAAGTNGAVSGPGAGPLPTDGDGHLHGGDADDEGGTLTGAVHGGDRRANAYRALVTTILALVKSEAHVVLTDDCYRRTRRFVTRFLTRFGVQHTVVPGDDL